MPHSAAIVAALVAVLCIHTEGKNKSVITVLNHICVIRNRIFVAFPQSPPAPQQPPSPPPPPVTTVAPDAGELQVEDVDESDVDGVEPDPAPLLILPEIPPPPQPEPKEDDGMHVA